MDVSVAANMPSAYTSTVMFETTQALLDEEEKKINDMMNGNDINDANAVKFRKQKMMAKIKNNKKTVAALAIGGTAAVVAVSFMSFGDVNATMDNIPILGGGGDLDLDVDGCCGDGECCGDADCDCDCGDCECIIM